MLTLKLEPADQGVVARNPALVLRQMLDVARRLGVQVTMETRCGHVLRVHPHDTEKKLEEAVAAGWPHARYITTAYRGGPAWTRH